MKKTIVVVSVSLALGMSGVASSANQSVSPKRWVGVFCGSVLIWEQTVMTNTGELNTTLDKLKAAGTVSLSKVRSDLVAFLGHIVHATNGLTETVRALGPPDIKTGSQLQKSVVAAFRTLTTDFAGAQSSARKLPVASLSAFSAAAKRLGRSITASGNKIKTAFTAIGSYSSPSLDTAANNDPSCKALARASSSSSGRPSGKVIAQSSSSGDFAIALATGDAKNPKAISVAADASPHQEVDVYWTMVCVRGYGAGSKSGSFSAEAPASKQLALPMRNPDDCTVSASAQLSNSGQIKVKLLSS